MDAFEALADPIRRDLLARLAHGPVRVVDLAAAYAVSRPAISRHLRLLTEAGLAAGADHGRERHYRLRAQGLSPVRDLLVALGPPRFSESVLDGLDLEVRRTGHERRASPSAHHEETG